MKITLDHIGKKYNRQWVFRNLSFVFEPGQAIALVGNNGSGKSTLLQIIYQYQTLSAGKIIYEQHGSEIAEEDLVGKVAFAAPYLELPEDFTLQEMLHFHYQLMPLEKGMTHTQMIKDCGLTGQENKYIKHFSSGMKQRLKLLMAVHADTPLLLLDEPCSNLDEAGIAWYRNLLMNQLGKKTILIASNQTFEYDFCQGRLALPVVEEKK